MQCEDNIVDLNWVDPSRVLDHVLFLNGWEKGRETREGEQRGREGGSQGGRQVEAEGCENRGVEGEGEGERRGWRR